MKKVFDGSLYIVNLLLFCALVGLFTPLDFQAHKITFVKEDRMLTSRDFVYQNTVLLKEKPLVEEKEPLVVPPKEETPPVMEEPPTVTPPVEPVLPPSTSVLSTVIGSLTGYGPDCYGCTSNRTASGYYIGEGNITYQDPTYGTVRILSGDKSYPFGTMVRIVNFQGSAEPVLAIVLDRGGSVGFGKNVLFDLAYASEKEVFGVQKNVTFEILRLGY